MKFRFGNRKKKKSEKANKKTVNDESLQIPSDEDGKIIFVYKESTPLWLIEELNKRFRSNKDRGSKCGVLPV